LAVFAASCLTMSSRSTRLTFDGLGVSMLPTITKTEPTLGCRRTRQPVGPSRHDQPDQAESCLSPHRWSSPSLHLDRSSLTERVNRILITKLQLGYARHRLPFRSPGEPRTLVLPLSTPINLFGNVKHAVAARE
jgi:hypothetical protein